MPETGVKFWRFGLLGYPLGHSLSPRLHTAALQESGLRGEYRLFAVTPAAQDQLTNLLESIRRGEVDGLNVTIPYKQTVVPLLDKLTPRAAAIGAVNTIALRHGLLEGDNTDGPGFLADLVRRAGWPAEKPQPNQDRLPLALVLGAGGSARAVAHALGGLGWHVWLAARRLEQARSLALSLRPHISGLIHYLTCEALPVLLSAVRPAFDLLVNTTPLGMAPEVAASPWPENLDFPRSAFVYDLVYNPPETAWLRLARAAGLRAVNGSGMLIEQAALSFELWTGRPAPRVAMAQAVETNA